MIDKQKVKEAIAAMTGENEGWRQMLDAAPGAANLRIALAFYASKFLAEMSQQEKDEYREFREMLERQLNAEELKYLEKGFERMGAEAARVHYAELFSKKSPEEQAEGQKAYDELMGKVREATGDDTGRAARPSEAEPAEQKGEAA